LEDLKGIWFLEVDVLRLIYPRIGRAVRIAKRDRVETIIAEILVKPPVDEHFHMRNDT